jgi:hypothetical protein
LFGRNPATLEDGDGRLPHQRDGIELGSVCPDAGHARKLAAFFDRGFQPRLSDRFSNVREFRDQLSKLAMKQTDDADIEALATELRTRFSAETTERQRRLARTLNLAWSTLAEVLRVASEKLNQAFVPTSSGDYSPNTDAPYRNMGLQHHYRGHRMRFWLQITCRFIGSEFLIVAEDFGGGNPEELLRTDAEDPNFNLLGRERLIARLLIGIRELPGV